LDLLCFSFVDTSKLKSLGCDEDWQVKVSTLVYMQITQLVT
jgi:hypothetical protein